MCVYERGRGFFFLNPSVIMCVCVLKADGWVNCLKMLKKEQKQSKHSLSLLSLHQHPSQSTVNSMKSDLTGYRKSNKNVSIKYQLRKLLKNLRFLMKHSKHSHLFVSVAKSFTLSITCTVTHLYSGTTKFIVTFKIMGL